MLTAKILPRIQYGLRATLVGILSLTFFIFSSAPQNAAATQEPADTPPNPHMVQDINQDPLPAMSSHFISLRGYFYFDVPANTCQLWRSDGTPSGTELFLELSYVRGSWGCVIPIVAGNLFYFQNSDPDHGNELWVSDGSQTGTHLLQDIAPGPVGIGLQKTLVVGDELFFFSYDSINGESLWITDGSQAETFQLYNAAVTPDSVSDPQLNNVQGMVYFIGNDVAHGKELWKSDGTPQGTSLVKDINPGSGGSYPFILGIQGDTIYFSANDGIHGTELWKSDGSSSGTQLIKDINPGPGDSLPALTAIQFISLNSELFFSAVDGTHGRELWKTNGTPDGTEMLMDFSAGPSDSIIFIGLETLNGELIILVGNTNASSYGLWRSDGSAGGTVLIKDFSGVNWLFPPTMLGVVNGHLFFAAANADGYQLFITDGSQTGTTAIYQFSQENPYLSFSAAWNGMLYFDLGLPAEGMSLWRSDGTAAGTVPVLENERSMIPLGEWDGNLLYIRDFTDWYDELWMINGVSQTLQLLKGAGPDYLNLVGRTFVDLGDMVYFVSMDSTHDNALWRSDGSPAGTQLVKRLSGSANSNVDSFTPTFTGLYFSGFSTLYPVPAVDLYKLAADGQVNLLMPAIGNYTTERWGNELTALGGEVFYTIDAGNPAQPAGLWRSDGTPAGTVLFLAETYTNGTISDLTLSGSQLYFLAHDDIDKKTALWRTDGSQAGTWQVLDLSKVGHLRMLADVNGTLFGLGYLNSGHNFLMVTDGTLAGTHYIHEFSDEVDPNQTLSWNGRFYFHELNKLWVSDGTTDGTSILGQFEYQISGNDLIPSIRNLTGAGSQVFFTAKDESHGIELWRTDGTQAGTLLVKDIYSGTLGSDPLPVASLGPVLYFTADDGLHGRELWRSDGTDAGTYLVKDIRSGEESSYPSSFAVLHNTLYFSASDGQSGQELWRSDGTETGTTLVKDIHPGASGSAPQVSVQAGRLYLAANDGVLGVEPWISDGTESGTFLMGDVNPGPSSSQPEAFTYWRGQVVFEAGDFEHGRELWVYDLGLMPRSYMPLQFR